MTAFSYLSTCTYYSILVRFSSDAFTDCRDVAGIAMTSLSDVWSDRLQLLRAHSTPRISTAVLSITNLTITSNYAKNFFSSFSPCSESLGLFSAIERAGKLSAPGSPYARLWQRRSHWRLTLFCASLEFYATYKKRYRQCSFEPLCTTRTTTTKNVMHEELLTAANNSKLLYLSVKSPARSHGLHAQRQSQLTVRMCWFRRLNDSKSASIVRTAHERTNDMWFNRTTLRGQQLFRSSGHNGRTERQRQQQPGAFLLPPLLLSITMHLCAEQ
jgi:hypothetical protein